MLGFRDLMALVGEFLFVWSAMEMSLSEAILANEKRTGDLSQVSGNLAERLEPWAALQRNHNDDNLIDDILDQAERLRLIRNLIVHGLIGGNSAPDDGCEPHIRCVVGGWNQPTGEVREITVTELKHYIAATDACRRSFSHSIRVFNYRLWIVR